MRNTYIMVFNVKNFRYSMG